MAGKFKKNCTAFPLTTFFEKNVKRLPFRSFWSQKLSKATVNRKSRQKLLHHLALKKQFLSFFLLINFRQTVFILHFPTKFAMFSVRDDARVSRDMKEWNDTWIKKASKFSSEMDFRISYSESEIPFQLTELNILSNSVLRLSITCEL